MSLTTEGNPMVMPVSPMYGGGNNSGFGFGNDGAWWILILLLFGAFSNGGWNGLGGGGAMPYVMGSQQNNDIQRGFDQQSIMGGLNGITSTISNGFANAEVSRCNAQANILQTLNANQASMNQGMNALAMSLQNCCCENRAATADLKYTVATEACADRAAISSALRDVIDSNTATKQAILDKLCQQEIDTLKAQNIALNTQLQMANLAASQNAQTDQLRQSLNPAPIPAYVVQNPSCCNPGYGNLT